MDYIELSLRNVVAVLYLQILTRAKFFESIEGNVSSGGEPSGLCLRKRPIGPPALHEPPAVLARSCFGLVLDCLLHIMCVIFFNLVFMCSATVYKPECIVFD